MTVAPISTNVDPDLAASATSELGARFGTSYIQNVIGSYFQHTGAFVTVNGIEGLWLTDVGSGGTKASNQTFENVERNKATYVFSPKATRGLNVGVYKVNTFTTADAVITPAVETGFRVGGVIISDIPPACAGVNFVIRAFAETGTAKTLISGQISANNSSLNITEIAAPWTNTPNATPTPSSDRTKLVTASPLVTALEGVGSLKITFNKASGRNLMDADDLDKLTVETQKDALIP